MKWTVSALDHREHITAGPSILVTPTPDLERVVYMDNHATTRVDPRVVHAMLPFFSEAYGNASSVGHMQGDRARQAVDDATETIARSLNASSEEIVFTSGATESNNLAIRGVIQRPRRRGNHIVSVATEHKAVLDPLAKLARKGHDVTLLSVEQTGSRRAGWLDPQKVADVIRDDTCLVTVMLANNEIGVIHPLAEIGLICKQQEVLLHCDATQAVGKIPVNVAELNVDLLSCTAHKLHGPKGIGALYVRRHSPSVRLEPQISGGGQQKNRRGGTLNVAGIVGFGAAIELCLDQMVDETKRLAGLRNRLADAICSQTAGATICGPAVDESSSSGGLLRLPGNLNLSFGDVDGQALQLEMGNLAVSSGAACTSTDPEPSHVLQAIGFDEDAARSSLRFGLGRFNTQADIDFAASSVVKAVQRLRKLTSLSKSD